MFVRKESVPNWDEIVSNVQISCSILIEYRQINSLSPVSWISQSKITLKHTKTPKWTSYVMSKRLCSRRTKIKAFTLFWSAFQRPISLYYSTVSFTIMQYVVKYVKISLYHRNNIIKPKTLKADKKRDTERQAKLGSSWLRAADRCDVVRACALSGYTRDVFWR